MKIAPVIEKGFPSLNPEQRKIVQTTDGPLLIIAGPGSGKTFSLVLRALNILCLGKAAPAEVVVCTFTEKAALELRDRIQSAAAKVGYKEDLTDLRVGTIHGICHGILNQFRHHTKLGNSFQVLDELTQHLFLFEQFKLIVEANRSDAIMEFDYDPGQVDAAGRDFDEVVEKIQKRDFNIVTVPARKVCKECDLKGLCASEKIIRPFPD